MSEPEPVYEIAQQFYICPGCKRELMPLYKHPQYEGIYTLGAGGLLIENMDGLCVHCGSAVHFRVNSQMLRKLVRDMNVEGIEL